MSSHKVTLKLNQLPSKAQSGYILPGMRNHSLISVTKLCKAGCQFTFGEKECVVSKNGNELIKGTKDIKNGPWYVPLTNGATKYAIQGGTHQASSAYHTATMEEPFKFMHQCLNLPTVGTLCKALDSDQLIGFPHMTSKLVRKYLPKSTATAKGHMNRNCKGL
jgi:hypothetical protein